ncbi:hypothetical protein T440DRAFT_438333 [Plenodomus tracheiphilus IPT5]|uniref:Uncharacterized protein n=1 Tax=Plenodomus tracheiphilus IPT5 TaxID=1408161 RepID=A0A6A7BP25_9PLEO|nr:hypothetical protein T440DRAFT_438333 [Plenodomus tracheiphilus IPT5]
MANAFISVGALVSTFLPLAFLSQKQPDPNKQTQISLGIGDNAYAGGSMPHIAVWDAHGQRITQYKGNKNRHVGDGAGTTIGLSLDNNQNGEKPAKPEYVSIVMHERDGICLAAVVAASQGVQWVWTGDIGYTCGAQWYASKYTFGGSNQPIRCVWLDADHGNGIIAKGLSLHMRDFSGEAGLLAQYKEDEKRLCQNSARMTFYPDILPDSIPQFFKPPLAYMRDESMGDPTKNSTAGALEKPDQGNEDRMTRAYPDGTDMNLRKRRQQQARSPHTRRRLRTRGVKNLDPDRLTVSHMSGHSAKELCEDSMSLGPDFVSKEEGLFCDMETATLWPLCTAIQAVDCFDLQTQNVNTNTTKRSFPAKTYKIIDEWK